MNDIEKFEKIEEKEKNEALQKKKKFQVSGRSVFEIQRIIKEKSSAVKTLEDKIKKVEKDGEIQKY